jgi:hypothetical protein
MVRRGGGEGGQGECGDAGKVLPHTSSGAFLPEAARGKPGGKRFGRSKHERFMPFMLTPHALVAGAWTASTHDCLRLAPCRIL